MKQYAVNCMLHAIILIDVHIVYVLYCIECILYSMRQSNALSGFSMLIHACVAGPVVALPRPCTVYILTLFAVCGHMLGSPVCTTCL